MQVSAIKTASRRKRKPSIGVLLFLGVMVLTTWLPRPALSVPPQYQYAQKAMRAGYYERALKFYLDLLKTDPDNITAHNGAALAHLKLQQYESAYQQARSALLIDVSNGRARALAGLALLHSGFLTKAALELKEALGTSPKDAYAWEGLAEIDYFDNRPKDARLKALYAIGLDPMEPDPLITLGRSCSRIESFAEAADAYERFLQVAPRTDTERRDRIRGLVEFYRRLSGLHLHITTGPKYVDVPFKLGSDRRPYIQVQLNGREATFVVDTGSGFTVISDEAAAKFGISAISKGGTSQGVGGSGKFAIVYGLINTLRIGAVKIDQVPCFIRPFHGRKSFGGEDHSDGFIGLSVLSNFLTVLDYKNQTISLARSADAVPAADEVSADATIVPFRITQNGLISVETLLNGNDNINAIIDSGASSTVISMAAVNRLKMKDSIIKGETVQVIGAGGITDNVELLLIHNCKVANIERDNLRALILDFGAINETSGFEQSGILGGDFLKHYRVIIDFGRGQVALEPQNAALEPKGVVPN
jgi:tetratricopeptide (TPR) repeat protein